MLNSPVAVIDIGSNSIKALVAERSADGALLTRLSRSIDARISAGIDAAAPRLSDVGMQRGLAAVQELLAAIAPHAPVRTILVATSAVRDAANGADFRARLRAATGHEVRLLGGEEEARLIGAGLRCDPTLQTAEDFYVFDLGGGSLECLRFRARQLQQAASLPLGCVRLTEKFGPPAEAPFTPALRAAISEHVRATLRSAAFHFNLPRTATAVGTGGTLTTVRGIRAARAGTSIEATSPTIPVAELAALWDELSALPLSARRVIPGLPVARADVFPTALATFLALAETGVFDAFQHSFCNLRWGVAAEALGL